MRVSLAEEANREAEEGESQAGRRAVEGRKGERVRGQGKDGLVQMVQRLLVWGSPSAGSRLGYFRVLNHLRGICQAAERSGKNISLLGGSGAHL